MQQNRDKRRRSDLDVFVLALVESGVSTPYELKTAAGLSPGASIPALARLLKARLIQQGKSGPRGRTAHKITAEGRRHLQGAWKDLLNAGPSGDLDADLRVALLAFWVGGDRGLAADFLRQSAAKRQKTARPIERPGQDPEGPLLAHWYRKLRSRAEEALIQGEATAALAMAKSLPRSFSGKSTERSSSTGA